MDPVLQKNVGTVINLSPTTQGTEKFLGNMILRRERKSELIKTKEFKSRRHLLQNNRSALKYRLEQEEGDSYASGMGFLDQDFLNEPPSSTAPFLEAGELHDSIKLRVPFSSGKIVVFDLKTTGLASNAEIVQIGAICDAKPFNIYIKPTKQITPSASAKNLLREKSAANSFSRVEKYHLKQFVMLSLVFDNFLQTVNHRAFLLLIIAHLINCV